MKILMIIDTIGRRGGAERQFSGLAVLLQKMEYDVNVGCYYPDEGYKAELEDAGVKVHMLNTTKGVLNKLFVVRKLSNRINPNIVIAFKDGPCEIACLLKFLGAKWKLLVSERSTTQKIEWLTFVKYNLYRFADAIVPNSNSQKQFLTNHFSFLSSKIFVITNFTDTELFKPQVIQKSSEKKSIIIVGRVSPEKNIIRFMEALSEVKNKVGIPFHVAWYGYKTDTNYFKICLEKRKELKLDEIIHFFNATESIHNEYAKHDFFCLPSLFEGYPNAVCEAMACGLPVIISDVCDNSNIISDGKNGLLFNPLSVENMGNTLQRTLMMSQEELMKLGKTSRNIAIQKFSKKTFLNKYITLINQLNSNKGE